MQVGYRQKSRFWSNSWLSKITGRVKCQKHLPMTKLSVYDTVDHAPLATDRLLDVRTTKCQKQLPTTMQCRSHQRMFVRDGLQHGPIRRIEENRKQLFAVVYLKPKQLIIKKTVLDVLHWSYTDTKHRAVSSRQQSFLLTLSRYVYEVFEQFGNKKVYVRSWESCSWITCCSPRSMRTCEVPQKFTQNTIQ